MWTGLISSRSLVVAHQFTVSLFIWGRCWTAPTGVESGTKCFRVDRTVEPERTAESPAFERRFDAIDSRMHPGATTGKGCTGIHNHVAVSHDEPHE